MEDGRLHESLSVSGEADQGSRLVVCTGIARPHVHPTQRNWVKTFADDPQHAFARQG
jgi:hypothetical protein